MGVTRHASSARRLTLRDALTIGLAVATVAAVLFIAATKGMAGDDPNEASADAAASVVIEAGSWTTLVARCPSGTVAEGGGLTFEPADALVTATAGIASPGTPQWAVGVVSADRRPVTVVATATCAPAGDTPAAAS